MTQTSGFRYFGWSNSLQNNKQSPRERRFCPAKDQKFETNFLTSSGAALLPLKPSLSNRSGTRQHNDMSWPAKGFRKWVLGRSTPTNKPRLLIGGYSSPRFLMNHYQKYIKSTQNWYPIIMYPRIYELGVCQFGVNMSLFTGTNNHWSSLRTAMNIRQFRLFVSLNEILQINVTSHKDHHPRYKWSETSRT